MILVGQYDSPYVRRVAISMRVLGLPYEHDTRSVFGDFDAMREVNPVGRIPSLVLDDGEVLIDSGAILDYLDDLVGPGLGLLPRSGLARRRALQVIALATNTLDKAGAGTYERVLRPATYRWPDWLARCRTQVAGGLAALEREPWTDALDQPVITTACVVRYVHMTDPELAPPGRYPALDALSARCEALPAFVATAPDTIVLPAG